MTKFIFDLDGTITKQEMLPLISKHFNLQKEIDSLTKETIQGNIPFIESFIRRVYILSNLPVNEIASLLERVKLHILVVDFINKNKKNCIIATGNLECWVSNLVKKIGCKYYCSDAISNDNKVLKLTKILRKEDIVKKYKTGKEKVVFIGDGNNSLEAMHSADVSIASGLTHMPTKSVLSIVDYVVFSQEALCRQLNQLL